MVCLIKHQNGMDTKYASLNLYSSSDFDEFEVCDRSISVDYPAIKVSSVDLLDSAQIAIGVAVKCCLRGKNVKPDDYFIIKKTKYMMQVVMEKLATQEGYKEAAADRNTIGKGSSKKLVSISRICRAFAPEVSSMIRDNKVKLEQEIADMAARSKLPAEYAFLDAPYGMDDATLQKHGLAVIRFAAAFDHMIAIAHAKGWVREQKGGSKRSHEEAAANYQAYRGIKPDLA